MREKRRKRGSLGKRPKKAGGSAWESVFAEWKMIRVESEELRVEIDIAGVKESPDSQRNSISDELYLNSQLFFQGSADRNSR